ncbi:MAG: ParA family protein [Longimonas sp.]|uniref:ParA family protein n=1 Tax=Longimonas sp. TaxID=2039626 RepID=UPI0039759301
MHVFTICNHKGGTGKTTSVIHIAAAMGLSGHRTLVVDLDPQGFLTRTMGIDPDAHDDTALSLFGPDADLWACRTVSMSGFDLLPSSNRLTREMRDLNKPTDVLWIREAIERNIDTASYDAVLFDTAAAVTVYSLNALVASQYAVIPVLPEYQSVVGAEQTYQTVSMVRKRLNPDLHPSMFLFTQVDERKRLHSAYRSYMRKKYTHRVLDTIIRTSTSLTEASEDGETVFDTDPQSKGARNYANATDDLLQRVKAYERKEAEAKANVQPVPSTPPPETPSFS